MITATPNVSYWGRPARPIIWKISMTLYSWKPLGPYWRVDLIMTRWAGKFTPAASVLVQQSALSFPSLNSLSTIFRSPMLRPAWWYAKPLATHSIQYWICSRVELHTLQFPIFESVSIHTAIFLPRRKVMGRGFSTFPSAAKNKSRLSTRIFVNDLWKACI